MSWFGLKSSTWICWSAVPAQRLITWRGLEGIALTRVLEGGTSRVLRIVRAVSPSTQRSREPDSTKNKTKIIKSTNKEFSEV